MSRPTGGQPGAVAWHPMTYASHGNRSEACVEANRRN
jgi:hypothetical protein